MTRKYMDTAVKRYMPKACNQMRRSPPGMLDMERLLNVLMLDAYG